jgi:hypothetical protein
MKHEHDDNCDHDHDGVEHGEIPDHDDDGSYALGYEVVPSGVMPKIRPKTDKPEPEAKQKPEEKPEPEKVSSERATPITRMDQFKAACERANIHADKPIYMVLATVWRSVQELKGVVGTGARGLTPEGENDLIQRITRQAEMSMRDSMAKHRVRLNLWTSVGVGAVCVLCLTGGGAAGYWMGWTGGRDSVRQVSQDVAVAFAHGPDGAKAAAVLLRNNNAALMLDKCTGDAVFVHEGRKACNGAFWIEPPPAAPVAGR